MAEKEHIILIKNMVCNRCILVVGEILKRLHFTPLTIELGMAVVEECITPAGREAIRSALEKYGFELIDDKREGIAEEIKRAIIELVHYDKSPSRLKLSEYLAERCRHEYSFLSKLFSQINGISIEKYYIAQKVERIKELLIYDDLSIGEIADMMQYSSVAHLSTQFRNITGMTPTQFKQLKRYDRKPLDNVI